MSRKFRVLVCAVTATLSIGSLTSSANAQTAIVLNEFNAVDDLLTLENDTIGDGGDSYWGLQRQGNGGNWVELVVTQDRADIRGWKLEWSNADPDSGSFTFTQHAFWSNVRAGTIITIREDDVTPGGTGQLPTDTSFSPQNNDWWVHINVDDPTFVSQAGFKVDNDSWQATIKDALGTARYGPIGEGLNSIGGWGGTGINSREIGGQTLDPASSTGGSGFQDLDYSTFGSPNYYNDPASGTLIRTQDFSSLRQWWTQRLPGDANVDGLVNSADFNILASNFGLAGLDWFSGDFTGDSTVNSADFNVLAANFGSGGAGAGSSVPEPAALSSVILMAALTARRTRR